MNVVYSSDNNYAQHLCVSLVSLLENNREEDEINIFIIENKIQDDSKNRIDSVVKKYSRGIYWISFEPYEKQLQLDMEWSISISSYARLFLADMLPKWCDRVIYLDCDTIICRQLGSLFNLDMRGCSVAGVEDLVLDYFKKQVGLEPSQKYINAGILLIDVNKWREDNITKLFINYIKKHNGKVTHHDQGVINGTLVNSCMILSPEYNVLTPFFTQKYNRIKKFYQKEEYYSYELIDYAKNNPSIIHFTPEYVGHIWERDCKHPKACLYKEYLELTPWQGNIFESEKKPLKRKVLYWCEAKMPIWFIVLIRKFY